LTVVSHLGYLLRPALGKEPTRDLKISEDAMAPGSRLQDLTAKYMQNPRRYFVPLANEYRNAHDLDRAISLCREHLPAQPGHMSGHIVLGRAYFEKGDLAAAQEVFLTSVALDDENLIALRHLGDIAAARQALPEARDWYTRVLDADPQNDEIERLIRALGLPDAPTGVSPSPLIAAAPDAFAHVPAAGDDPTPPGLRAITDPAPAKANAGGDDSTAAALPPEPWRTLGTMDLSTLDDSAAAEVEDVITVDAGVGFTYGELDQLVDPSASTIAGGPTLPPIDEADFSSGVQTPATSPVALPSDGADDLLSRPGFGALASFASWRTAQARDTPSSVPAAPVAPLPTAPSPSALDATSVDGGLDIFDEPGLNDSAPTAPEFVTETMAALYAQQGFTRQALDVYQALLRQSPDDARLRAKIAELEGAIGNGVRDAELQEDADKALQFGELNDGTSRDDNSWTAHSGPNTESDGRSRENAANSPSGDLWESEPPTLHFTSDDDWFSAGARSDDSEVGVVGEDIFGVLVDGFGAIVAPGLGERSNAGVPAEEFAQNVPIANIFGSRAFSVSDESAADFLTLLATELVCRLPKETPSLPVPDLLDLPSSDTSESGSDVSAPLLSFDRFFSGSGSPSRQRIDTPTASGTPMSTAPRASLSPTFGGVPVVPPPAWPGFDQFVSPSSGRPIASGLPGEPQRVTPSSPPPDIVLPQAIVGPTPAVSNSSTPPTWIATPPAIGSLTSTDSASATAPPAREPIASPATPSPEHSEPESAAKPAPQPTDAEPPSDFHRWLKGLS